MALTMMAENDVGDYQRSGILTNFAIRLLSLRPSSVMIAFVSLFCVTPLLLLLSLGTGLLSFMSPVETLMPWLTGQALADPSVSLKAIEDGTIVSAGVAAIAAVFVVTPGQAVQLAALFYSAILVVLFMSASATRLPLLPAILVTCFGALAIPIARMTGLSDFAGFSLGLMAWLAIIGAQSGRFLSVRPIQAEGLGAGVALGVLFFSTLPLFIAASVSVALAAFLRGRPGRDFASIAIVSFAVILLAAELVALITIPGSMLTPTGLTLSRLTDINIASGSPALGLPHLLTLLAAGLSLLLIQHGPRTFIGRLVSLGAGLIACFASGLDPLIFIGILSVSIVFGAPRSDETIAGPAMPLSTLACLACFALAATVPLLNLGTTYLVEQYRIADRVDDLGLVFVGDGSTGTRLAKGQLPVGPFRSGENLTPADQAAIFLAGLELAQGLAKSEVGVFIVAGDGKFPLLAQKSAATSVGANIILSPRIALDPETEATRVSLQGYLYTHYKRVNRSGSVSPVWEVWQRDE